MRGRHRLAPSDYGFYAALGKAIREIREAQGMTQDALAQHLSLTRTSLVNIEQGRQHVRLHTLMLIAQGLGVPYWSFIPEHAMPKPRVKVHLPLEEP